jgi:hypothetical protein
MRRPSYPRGTGSLERTAKVISAQGTSGESSRRKVRKQNTKARYVKCDEDKIAGCQRHLGFAEAAFRGRGTPNAIIPYLLLVHPQLASSASTTRLLPQQTSAISQFAARAAIGSLPLPPRARRNRALLTPAPTRICHFALAELMFKTDYYGIATNQHPRFFWEQRN